ncbi:alpha/beta fold hydrolase [soil metagenome]
MISGTQARIALYFGCAVLNGCTAPADDPAEPAAIRLEDCTLRGTSGLTAVSAECGTITVPEDRARRDGRQIELFVARVPALSLDPPDDALTVIAGGPGQASTEFFADYAGAFEPIRRERDILLVDQRGTGRSNALGCPTQQLAPDSPAALRKAARECLTGLGGDPRFYTTSVAVEDLDRARAALGYAQLNLYGVSYGTRVAQHYLRRFPDHSRTVILDSVVPMDIPLGPRLSVDAQAALELVFARCAAEAACAERFPDLPDAFAAIRKRLEDGPVPVQLTDPATAMPRQERFGNQELALAVRLLSYTAETASYLPLLLHHAHDERDFAPLAAQLLMVGEQLEASLSYGMHNAVACTEDVPFYDLEAIDRTALDRTYLGATQLDALVAVCDEWPAGVIDENLREPVRSRHPVLLLAGSADPVTPPANATRVARHLDQALVIAVEGLGHGIAGAGCIPRLMAEFVAAASFEPIDRSCAEDIEPAPFFLSFAGPAP